VSGLVAAHLGTIAERLFTGVMAPLVLGGAVRPGHAIGARAALALGDGERRPVDVDLAARVEVGRVRRARVLAPIDTLEPASADEWALAAALHDVLHAANPEFDAALRRGAATRILALAVETIDRVRPPSHVRAALSRHSWFARLLEVARTDTAVSWWIGSRTYLGVDPPHRLQAWPELRRVSVVATPRPLLELTPLAVDRAQLSDAVARLLTRTPLTDLSTCARQAPDFGWSEATLALVGTRAGRTLALRALERLPAAEVDAVLGRATRELLASRRGWEGPAVAVLAERALGEAERNTAQAQGARPEAAFARGLGAAAAARMLEAPEAPWSEDERRRLLAALEPATRSAAAQEARAMLAESA
jgi:hypothetical protein